MNIGLMWYSPEPNLSLEQKIERAAAHYAAKYGKTASLCYVHPSQASIERAGAVEVKGHKAVRKNHLWLGMGE